MSSIIGVKVSVSLPEDDVDFLDAYADDFGLGSRSAAVQAAVRALRESGLSSAYETAFREWSDADEAAWDSSVADGLGGDDAETGTGRAAR